ncbi:hypothetical protein AB6D20_027850 (plasmid) [Vibrio splendidus]
MRIRTTLTTLEALYIEALYISVANESPMIRLTGLTDNHKKAFEKSFLEYTDRTPVLAVFIGWQSEATVTRTFRRTRASSRLSC